MQAQRPQAYAHSCTFMFMFIITYGHKKGTKQKLVFENKRNCLTIVTRLSYVYM